MGAKYPYINLREQITIDKLYSFHYTELRKGFVYKGERHNFWEFLYVDKGEVEITTDFQTYQLKQGDIIFYSPNEFHSLQCNKPVSPNIFIISFECHSTSMHFFTHKSWRLGDEERQLFTRLIQVGNELFIAPADKSLPAQNGFSTPKQPLVRKKSASFGAEQLIKNYVEVLLICLIRNDKRKAEQPKLSSIAKQKRQGDLSKRIISYMEEHLSDKITLDKLCMEFSISPPHLRTVFREQTGFGVKEYVVLLRIERAKRYIREETSNLTEISEKLGYSSIHFFSRQFKKVTDISPSEYQKSIKAQM